MAQIVIAGTIGSASLVWALLEQEIRNGNVVVDFGHWLSPIRVYYLDNDTLAALKELLTEKGVPFTTY